MNRRTSLIVWPLLILAALAVLELTRRSGETAVCYARLRYHPELIDTLPAEKWGECARRHLNWPLHFSS